MRIPVLKLAVSNGVKVKVSIRRHFPDIWIAVLRSADHGPPDGFSYAVNFRSLVRNIREMIKTIKEDGNLENGKLSPTENPDWKSLD